MNRRDSRDEHERLCRIISRWNERRMELGLLQISMPNENLEFEGVMKFYFQYQDDHRQKVATKCIRVSNTATVKEVIEVLVQKFRPDLRMLPNLSSYALYEVHDDEEERRMDIGEKPLLAMLKWTKDGRFLLRNELKLQFSLHSKLVQGKKSAQTKRKKKSPKIERKKKSMNRTYTDVADVDRDNGEITKSVYIDYPPSHFPCSISNPDINSGKTTEMFHNHPIPITIGNLMPEMPVKSILAVESDTAAQIVASTVEKFDINYDPDDFCLVQVTMEPDSQHPTEGNLKERVLDDEESPVKIHREFSMSNSKFIKFQLRRKDSFKAFSSAEQLHEPIFPVLMDVHSSPNSTPSHCHRQFRLSLQSTEIGSHVSLLDQEGHICLSSHGIRPHHCVITQSSDAMYMLSLLDQSAHVQVNENVVTDPVQLLPNCIIHLGDKEVFKFVIPSSLHHRSHSAALHVDFQVPIHNHLAKAYSSDDLDHSLYDKGHFFRGDNNPYIASSKIPTCDESNIELQTSVLSKLKRTAKRHNSVPGEPILVESSETELAVLPASLIVAQTNVYPLLQCLIADINGSVLQFKLAPAYAIYMIARHHLSSEFIPEGNRHHSLIFMLKTTCSFIKKAVKESKNIAGALAFWLSNTSELLHFLRRDYRLYMFAHEFENSLTSIIHMAYKHFTEYMVREINVFLSAFLSDSPDADNEDISYHHEKKVDASQEPDVVAISHNSSMHQTSLTSLYWSAAAARIGSKGRATLGDVLSTLSATASLLHLCKVNHILSRLIFSLLFRYISMRLFNKLITEPRYCSKAVGQKLLRRLDRLKIWADKESLKLPADEHLQIICQAANLLISVNNSSESPNALHSLFPQLNSHQIKVLLSNYETNDGENVPSSLLDILMARAFNDVDQQLLASGHEIHLQEDPNLELPFLIPEHGYSCDTMRGVPVGLEEYLDAATSSDLCQLIVSKDSLGCWVPPRVTTSKQRESPISTQASTQMSQTLPRNFSSSSYSVFKEKDRHYSKSSLNISSCLEDFDTITVTLNKEANKSLGINICELRDPFRPDGIGIFIKSLSKDGPAAQDGRLHSGDQILKIDGTSMIGYTKELVIKFLRNSPDQVTITVAPNIAQIYQLNDVPEISPDVPRKVNRLPQNFQVPTPKEGSSHAMKAARRELRRQKQAPNRYELDYHPHSYIVSPVPHAPNSHMAKWLQEQQEIAHQKKPSPYERISIPSKVNLSMSSLIPEREEPSLPTYNRVPSENYLLTDSDTSEIFKSSRSPYSHHNVIDSAASRLVDPRTESEFLNYQDFDSSTDNNSQMPFKDLSTGLSCHPSDIENTPSSQTYPSLAREKLSMEVGYHTQLSSTGLSVSSVLDQLSRRGKRDEHGLQVSELQELEVDEIQLEKQRMQLLFYRQQKDAKDQASHSSTVDQQEKWPSKSHKNSDENEEELLMDPNKLMKITKLRQSLDSIKKIMNDQRKRCRELHFAKEREEQILNQVETRLKSQSRHFMSVIHPESDARWQRDQKRRLKEMERQYAEKKEEVLRLEVKECEAKTKLKALEVYANDLKKQLQICEKNMETSRDVPEKEWPEVPPTRQLRVMSTDSITTGSSWLSNENITKDTISIESESNIPEFRSGADLNSPLGCYSDSSSPGPFVSRRYQRQPEFYGSSELPTLIRNSEVMPSSKYPTSHEQEERLRMLKEEHSHHLSSVDSISSRTPEEKTMQINQLKKEGCMLHTEDSSENYLSSTNHMKFTNQLGNSIDNSNIESSLSSSTPDVVPQILAPPITKSSVPHLHQSFDTSTEFLKLHQPNIRPTSATAYVDSHPCCQIPPRSHDHILSRPKSHDNLFSEQLGLPGGSNNYQFPDRENISNRPRKAIKAGGPHSYSSGRPNPPSNEERGRGYRERGSTPSVKYVQRQQTEL